MTTYIQKTKYNEEKKELGLKYDGDKARFDLIEPEFEEDIANILTAGANKYAPNSWQHVEDGNNRYYAALRRHLNAWRKGEKIDQESGMSHLAHVACNVMFLMHFEREENKL